MTGLYTAPERVERDGRLVAFKGEIMTIDDAKRRGIYEQPEKPAAKKRAPRKRAAKKPETETAEG